MKRLLTNILMAVGITGPFVAPVVAQTNTEVAKIPFAFVAGNKTMPAGEYKVSQLRDNSPFFQISDRRVHSVFVQLGSVMEGNPEQPSLTFACYGSEGCILTKVTPPASLNAYGLGESSIRRKLDYKLGVASMVSIKLTPR